VNRSCDRQKRGDSLVQGYEVDFADWFDPGRKTS
jgi:hypothetical protein